MVKYKQESHLRSLIKGITWRIIALLDTVVIVLIVTCLQGNCSLESALKIGFYEFFIKIAVYYLHERVWQFIWNGKSITSRQILFKSISWRFIATCMTFLISGVVLDAFNEVALYIALIELFTKFVLYYLHERLWLKLPIGKIRTFFRIK